MDLQCIIQGIFRLKIKTAGTLHWTTGFIFNRFLPETTLSQGNFQRVSLVIHRLTTFPNKIVLGSECAFMELNDVREKLEKQIAIQEIITP